MNDLLETFPLATIVVDKNYTILGVNKAGLVFLDTELSNVVSKNIKTIFHQIDIDALPLNKYFKTTYINSKGIACELSIQYCRYLKEEINGLFYIEQKSLVKRSAAYSEKKNNLQLQKLNILESFLQQVNHGIFLFDESGQLLYRNEMAAISFELKNKKINQLYAWQLFDFIGNEFNWERIKKNLEFKNEIEHAINKFDVDSQNVFKLAVVVKHQLVENQSYYVMTFSDITAIEKDKFVLNEKESHLNLFHKNVPAVIFEFVLSGKVSYFNYISNAFKRIFGFDIAINDKKWNSKIKLHPDDFQRFIDSSIDIKSNLDKFKFIGRFLHENEVIWFETNASVTYVDGLVIFNGIILNVTERAKNEEDIANKRKIIDSILFNIPADIALFDKDHNYQFINSKGIENKEIREWMIGKNDFDYCRLKGIDNTLAKIRRAKFNKAKKSKKTVEWIDQSVKNNKNIHIYRKLYPVYDNDEFTYMIGYGIDVTTLKETQYQLEIQNKILTNKNQELERFTYIASHDLQEPLLSLISFSKILEDEYSEKLDEEGRMFVQFINNSATRMRSLISGLMEYNRINLKEILDPYDFNVLLQEVQDDLNNSISNHKAIITIQKLPTLRCYPTFVRILFQNLISNAIKFTTKEVIPQIEISSLEREKDWLFKVSDNGIGIPVKNLQEIFMVFKRLHKEQNYAGLGIGLAHCKKIVEIHNGEIWVDSVEGTGSIFYFTIAKKI